MFPCNLIVTGERGILSWKHINGAFWKRYPCFKFFYFDLCYVLETGRPSWIKHPLRRHDPLKHTSAAANKLSNQPAIHHTLAANSTYCVCRKKINYSNCFIPHLLCKAKTKSLQRRTPHIASYTVSYSTDRQTSQTELATTTPTTVLAIKPTDWHNRNTTTTNNEKPKSWQLSKTYAAQADWLSSQQWQELQ